MLQFLIYPVLIAMGMLLCLRNGHPILGLICGIWLGSYIWALPLGGFVVWMGAFLMIWLACKVITTMLWFLS